MLKQAVISEILDGTIGKSDGFISVVTRYFPRFLPKDKIDEYVAQLSPTKKLLADFKNASKRIGHDPAFLKVKYQERFTLTEDALAELHRLALISQRSDVYLACYCSRDHYCHREMLLLLAQKLYGAVIDDVAHDYSQFLEMNPLMSST
jgi:uncharacterized protein YeaO (DUF488 family)